MKPLESQGRAARALLAMHSAPRVLDEGARSAPYASTPIPNTRETLTLRWFDAAAASDSLRDALKEQGLPTTGSVSLFVQARRAHEDAKAHIARLKLQRMRGEFVDRNNAIALVFQLAREERDSWLNWPARVAALMAAELGVDAHSMQKVLETHVRAHLASLAEPRLEFRA